MAKIKNRKAQMGRLLKWIGIAVVCCAAHAAGAQPYPSKAIRLIVPWSGGSGTDLMARSCTGIG